MKKYYAVDKKYYAVDQKFLDKFLRTILMATTGMLILQVIL